MSSDGVNWFEGGRGEPLLLLNGWTASGLVWPTAFVRRLEDRFRVIRLDNRGSGFSRSARSPFTMADLADDAHTILGRLGIRSARVLGMSMGGMIAQELALRHPNLVERLFLVATSPPAPAALQAEDEITWHMFRRRRRGESYRDYMNTLWVRACGPGFTDRRPDLFGEMLDQLSARPTTRPGAMAQARAAGCWSGPQRLADISAPTTVIHGTEDVLRPVGNGMRLARLIPDAQYIELAGVGHLIPLEAADQLAGLVAAG